MLMLGIIIVLIGVINEAYVKEQWRWWRTDRPFLAANMWPYVLTPAAEQALKPDPNQSFRECAPKQQDKDYCPDMVVVPAGLFMMGSPATEQEHTKSEEPLHQVTFAKPFAVSKYELTFDEWDTCVNYGDCPQGISDSGFGRGQQPVINVTWDDAQRYVAWLSKMTGKTYRLLSEAEYEYATRAGATTSARTMPIATAAAASGITRKRRRLAPSLRIGLGSMTWWATCLGGRKIAPTTITMARRPMAQPGSQTATASYASSAAVPGATLQTTSARRAASGAPPSSGAAASASGWGGRFLPLESLSLCLLGAWGRSPQLFYSEDAMNDHAKRTGPAVEAHYQFLLWLVPTVDRFPKSQKFVFGDRVLSLALDVLEFLVEAAFTRDRKSHLARANLGIDKLRFLIRMSADFRYLDRRRYEHAARSLDEIGRLIGGWSKAHDAATAG
jgi:Sulfatase-modifying factor enzyme 1